MKRNQTLLLLFLLCGQLAYAGGPWLVKKGSGYFQAQTIFPTSKYSTLLMGSFTQDQVAVNRETFNMDAGLYLEYGFKERVNLVVNLPFKYVKTGNRTGALVGDSVLERGSLAGLGNFSAELKFGLLDKDLKVSASIVTRLNTVAVDSRKGLATGVSANSLGISVAIGKGFSHKFYGYLSVGYHAYDGNFSDMFELSMELGKTFGDHFTVALFLEDRHSMKNGDVFTPLREQTGLFPNNQEWAALNMKLNYEFDNSMGVNVGFPITPIRSRYVGYNGTFAMGVYKKF